MKINVGIQLMCLVAGLALIYLGVVKPLTWGWSEVFWEIIRHIGIALLISGFIGSTVETFVKKRTKEEQQIYLNEIGQNVFHAVLKQNFPPAIYEQVKSQILLETFVRKNFTTDMSMIAQADSDYLVATVSHSYELHRISDVATDHTLESYLDLEIFPGVTESSRFKSLIVEDQDGTKICEYDETNISGIIKKTDEWLLLSKIIDMKNHRIVKIRMQSELYFKKTDYHTWSMTSITENLTLNMYTPEKLKFMFSANHPSKDLFTLNHNGVKHTYDFKGGILPEQGVTISWQPS
jgi:hypothetical protein